MRRAVSWLSLPLSTLRSVWILLAAFAASRIAYYAAGVRFDLRPLTNYYQLVDPALLENHLLQTCWYMHTQPPGFNFLVGLVLKAVSGASARTVAFGAAYLLMDAASVLLLLLLQKELRVLPRVALALTVLFAVSPGLLLHENLLMYEPPQLFALLAGAYALARLLRTGGLLWLAVFSFSIAGIAILRPTYHLLWVAIAAFGPIWFARRTPARKLSTAMWIAALLACAAVGAFYVKNFVLYHRFGASTFAGVQADSITAWQLTPAKREEFIAKGLISPISRVPGDAPLAEYKGYLHPVAPTGIPILDQEKNSTGRDNLNNLQYLQADDIYIHDAIVLLRIYPQCYLQSVAIAWFTYFLPTGDFPFFDYNRPKIFGWDRLFNLLVFGQWKDAADRKRLRREGPRLGMLLYESLSLLVLLPLLFCYGSWLVWRDWRGIRDSAFAGTVAFIVFTIATVSFISTFFASFECNRYRFPIDGFFVCLLAMAVSSALKRLQSQQSPAPAMSHGVPPERAAR